MSGRQLKYPLGVHLVGGEDQAAGNGATAAVFAAHANAVSVCLLNGEVGQGLHIREEVSLPRQVEGTWYGEVPGARAGDYYALRVDGPWEPAKGLRHNPAKLLLDPYARFVVGEIDWGQPVFGHTVLADWTPAGRQEQLNDTEQRDHTANLGHCPVGVIATAPRADASLRPRVPWPDTVVYEAHLRGLTRLHPQVPAPLRGTWAGLAHPAVVEYLVNLGITAVELLPVFAIGDEVHLVKSGLRNYWGYNTLGFFAPHLRYVSGEAQRGGPQAVFAEIRDAIATLHEAGLEVWLDVVYNHTCEAGLPGPTLSWRGIDAASYYRLDSHGRHVDVTGCGNTLDFSHPRVVQLALDSLRYWTEHFGVDGYRFDLAPALARRDAGHGNAFDSDHPFLVAARTDPTLSEVKLVAEPWDLGHNGWQTGHFPPPFAEWNDHFRNATRTFWLADAKAASAGHDVSDVSELATRMAGSSDTFGGPSHSADGVERPVSAAVNYVTAHDGFTLADLTMYERRHNEANRENNRDGSTDNRSWHHGAEGPTDHPVITAARQHSAKAMLGTLLLAAGTPMLLAGDEMGRSQRGNNNAYCQDNDTTWIDWSEADHDLVAHVRTLLRIRAEEPALRQLRRFTGRVDEDGVRDISWYGTDGRTMTAQSWHDPSVRTLQMLLDGSHLDASPLLVILHGGLPEEITLPNPPRGNAFSRLWSSDETAPVNVARVPALAGAKVHMPARCVQVWRVLDTAVPPGPRVVTRR
ncbi:MAG: glycogen debranching enzyme GlgX [Micrococcales bacterium]|nr:MAG: glycogen debranching enzyme GlgX [Micrococcales bacterium]PIE27549.1 MAG: glycogen debranching enzyme GlgX [Micrococcales bacterium]